MHELRKPRILCIGDTANEVEIRVPKSVLEIAGYEVLATHNAREAVQNIRNNDVELVLTEHIVPMDGGLPLTEVLESLKPQVPVGIYSGGWAPLATSGWPTFITKLVSTHELLCTLEDLLGKAQPRVAA